MSYKLIHRASKESVDTTSIPMESDEVARYYFIQKKQLSEKSFDKLYEVKKEEYDRDRPTRF
mgnify:FL=1